MMGPLAGYDPVFWFTVRPIPGALGVLHVAGGSCIIPVLFVLGNVILSFLWYTQSSIFFRSFWLGTCC